MTLKDAYRLALARGLTAKQAGAEFGLDYQSISKMKSRLGLPSLISEYDYAERKAFESFSDSELKSYLRVLMDKGFNLRENKEWQFANYERERRGL